MEWDVNGKNWVYGQFIFKKIDKDCFALLSAYHTLVGFALGGHFAGLTGLILD